MGPGCVDITVGTNNDTTIDGNDDGKYRG
jgi:hypothetical protein